MLTQLLILSLGGYNLHILLLLLLFRAKGTVYQRTQVSITLFDRFMFDFLETGVQIPVCLRKKIQNFNIAYW